MQYRREVDGLRALAVLPVILFHAGLPAFSGGFVGVDVFFVISGYLITSILVGDLVKDRFSIVTFYERRARRILPAFFFVVFACLPLAWLWLLASDMKDFSRSLVAVSFFSSNILFYLESGYFQTAAELKPLLHTWSLAVEEQFYLFFPLLLALLWRGRRRWLVVTLAAIAVGSLALAQWGSTKDPTANFFLLPTRAWELMIGALIALRMANAGTRDADSRWAPALAALGAAMIVFAIVAFDEGTPFPSVYALVPTLGTGLIILYGRADAGIGRVLSLPVFVGIGLISYSAYLWHQPLFALARHRDGEPPHTVVFLALSALSLVLAWFSWRFVERPFRTPGLMSRRTIFTVAGVGTAAMLAVGAAGIATNGYIARFAPEDRYLAGLNKREMGDYVRTRFDQHRLKPFDAADPRPKVLLIGDSFGEDLVNALHENGMLDRMQLSTHYIAARCGNLHLREDFSDQIASIDRRTCEQRGWYERPSVQALLRQADHVWLASSWKEWQAERLPASLANIEQDFGRRAVVIGRKHFGTVNIKGLLLQAPAQRLRTAFPMMQEHIETNALMMRTLPADQFVNVSLLLCGEGPNCPAFDDQGQLISHDGAHLTPAGAALFGRKLLGQAPLTLDGDDRPPPKH